MFSQYVYKRSDLRFNIKDIIRPSYVRVIPLVSFLELQKRETIGGNETINGGTIGGGESPLETVYLIHIK